MVMLRNNPNFIKKGIRLTGEFLREVGRIKRFLFQGWFCGDASGERATKRVLTIFSKYDMIIIRKSYIEIRDVLLTRTTVSVERYEVQSNVKRLKILFAIFNKVIINGGRYEVDNCFRHTRFGLLLPKIT